MASEMECKEARQKLSEALDADLDSTEKASLGDHLESCASCKAEQGDLEQVHALVKDLAEPAVDVPDTDSAWSRLDLTLGQEEPGDLSPFDEVDEHALLASGVMDIKDMMAKKVAAPSAAAEQISTSDFFGLSGGGGSAEIQPTSVAPPPVLMPVAQRPGWLVPVFVAGGVLVLSVLALGVVLFVGEGRQRKAAEEKVAHAGDRSSAADMRPAEKEEPSATAEPTAASSPARPAATVAGARPEGAAEEPARDAVGADSASGSAEGGKHSPRRGGRRRYRGYARGTGSYLSGGPGRPARARASRTEPVSGPRERPRGSFSDDPLSALLGKGKARGDVQPSPRPAAASGLPSNLSRSQIRSVMSKASVAVKRCFETHKQPGLMRVSIAIKGSTGRIVSATVKGKFKGTATARCALRTIQRLKFPKFVSVTQRFTYPFLLR